MSDCRLKEHAAIQDPKMNFAKDIRKRETHVKEGSGTVPSKGYYRTENVDRAVAKKYEDLHNREYKAFIR